MSTVLDWSLTGGVVPGVVYVAGALAGLAVLYGRGARWWGRQVPAAVLVGVLSSVGFVQLVDRVWHPFPDPVPLVVAIVVGLFVAALALALLRAGSWRMRVAAVMAALAVGIAGATQVNQFFGAYPTVRSVLGLPLVDEVRPARWLSGQSQLVIASPGQALSGSWTPPPDMPSTGVVSTVTIPGATSGFRARPAWVYIPPAYLGTPRARLPVLILLPGQPGAPRDWFDGGRLAARMDAFAASHTGLAPIVVVADPLGSQWGETLCVDSRRGNVFTYLSVDVPRWVRSNLQADPDPHGWAVGGFSAGGTCALQLAVNAPTVYPTFVDISGQDEPTLGKRDRTVADLFGGNASAFRQVNPRDVLARQRFPDSAGFVVVGTDDSQYRPQARTVVQETRTAGMDITYLELPGDHTWKVWATGLERALPWIASRTGLTP